MLNIPVTRPPILGGKIPVWAARTAYRTDDLVRIGNDLYRCRFDHTSSQSFNDDAYRLWAWDCVHP